MKNMIFSVLIILVLTAYTPAALAVPGSSTVLAISLANYDPNPAIAGDTVDIRIGIQNIGGMDINDLMMEIVPSYPFELVSGENAIQDVGIVQGYQVDSYTNIKIAKYTMKINKETPAGSYELKVKYYQKGSTDVIQKSLYLDVKSRENAEVIHIDRSTLVPGKQTSLKFTINNVGSSPLRDLTFNWENTDNIILPVGSDNTKYIKYIDIDNNAELEYQVIADTNAQPGLYKLNLYLTYEDSISNKTKKISTIAGVYVGGGTDFDVAFSDNANSQTSFSIANIGSNPASSVSVIIPVQQGWRVSGSSSVIIGNLNKGDYTVASFNLQSTTSNMTSQNMDFQNRSGRVNGSSQARSAQQSMNALSNSVLMQIAYTDTMGERKIVEKQVNVGSSNMANADVQTAFQGRRGQQENIFSNYALYFIGIIVIVGIVLGHRKYRNRKLLDPDFKIKDLFKSEKKI